MKAVVASLTMNEAVGHACSGVLFFVLQLTVSPDKVSRCFRLRMSTLISLIYGYGWLCCDMNGRQKKSARGFKTSNAKDFVCLQYRKIVGSRLIVIAQLAHSPALPLPWSQ